MALSRADLIMHPVRIRLLASLAHRQLTARQLSQLLPDVPQATLYHHLVLLTGAGLLRIVSKRQTRGTVEKVYALANDRATLSPTDTANASRDDHLRFFTAFVALLLGDFTRYLEQLAPIDPVADGVSYSETPVYLSDDEFAQASQALNQALLPFLHNEPAPQRRRRLLAVAVFPGVEVADAVVDGTSMK